jgi:nitroreductase
MGIYMNETIQTIIKRRSVKNYLPRQIKDEDLELILTAGMYAPSARNQQSALFIVVQDEETLQIINRLNIAAGGQAPSPYHEAPTVILVLADKTAIAPVEDASLALGNMLNAAASLGLGSCWVHRTRQIFDTAEGRDLLKKWGVEGDYIGVGSCILGYPDGPVPEAKPRKDKFVIYAK